MTADFWTCYLFSATCCTSDIACHKACVSPHVTHCGPSTIALFPCTVSPLHCFTIALFHCFIVALFYHMHCTVSPLHCCTVALLHCFTVALFHRCTVALFHCSTVVLLHHCTVSPLHHCTVSQRRLGFITVHSTRFIYCMLLCPFIILILFGCFIDLL